MIAMQKPSLLLTSVLEEGIAPNQRRTQAQSTTGSWVAVQHVSWSRECALITIRARAALTAWSPGSAKSERLWNSDAARG